MIRTLPYQLKTSPVMNEQTFQFLFILILLVIPALASAESHGSANPTDNTMYAIEHEANETAPVTAKIAPSNEQASSKEYEYTYSLIKQLKGIGVSTIIFAASDQIRLNGKRIMAKAEISRQELQPATTIPKVNEPMNSPRTARGKLARSLGRDNQEPLQPAGSQPGSDSQKQRRPSQLKKALILSGRTNPAAEELNPALRRTMRNSRIASGLHKGGTIGMAVSAAASLWIASLDYWNNPSFYNEEFKFHYDELTRETDAAPAGRAVAVPPQPLNPTR